MSAAGRDDRAGPSFWVACAVGGALMAWGAWLLVEATAWRSLVDLGLWLVLGDLVLDWVVVPVVLAAGWLVSRWAPPWSRAPLQVALILTGAVLLVGALPLAESAEPAGNPTIQPIEYPKAIGATLAVVWSLAGAWAIRRRQVRRG